MVRCRKSLSSLKASPIIYMIKACNRLSNMIKSAAEGKQRDTNTNEVQKHLQLHDVSLGEYVTDKCALWLNFRTINENILHGLGRMIGSTGGGITLQIKKKAEMAGALEAFICLIMDAQLNIENGAFISAVH